MATITPSSPWHTIGTTTFRKHRIQWPGLLSWLAGTLALVSGLTLLKNGLVFLLLKLYEYFIEENMLRL